ncbi:MAG TPA: hypothetical protein PLF17_12115 [Chitinophagaceae bacterium]|nr:hypothetical protein [Chitinophagaceae bacterium]
MATFTITTSKNIDELASKTGADVYNINGGTLTIDQDSRNGLNQTTSSTLAAVTLSASLGGVINIDGTSIWMIPYTGGSGNVPAWNTAITNNGATGKLIGVHASLTSASTATGAAMPATGFIRVKQKSGTYAAGALTGITATASDEGRVGWIEIVGDEAATITANRLGNFNITGAWYEIGTTNGSAGQTMQIPNNGLLRYVAGVFIEQTVAGGDYEFYPNAGIVTTTGTEAARGKCVWINNAGLVTIGNSGAATNGYTPVSGLKVVVGNVFLENCTTAARTANVIPNATIATRYDFTTTGGGVINIDKCNMAWYLSCAQAYSVNVSNSGFIDSILLSEVATSMTFTNMGVGNKPTTALVVAPLSMSLCFAGGTFTDCVFQRIATAANNSTTVILTDIDGFTFTRLITRCAALRAHTGLISITATRAANCTFTDLKMIDGQFSLVTCTNVTITNMNYINGVSGTTGTANPLVPISLSSNCLNTVISGFSLPITNNHPYTSLFAINAAGCTNTKIRSIGTRATPLSLGSANATGLIFSLAAGAAANDVRIQRVYCSNTRTGIMTADNSSTKVLMESVFGDYADATNVSAALNMTQKGLGTTKALTAQTSVYGTHWIDYFTSTTAGRIGIVMNEPTAITASQVTLANGAAFTSAGGLYMPVIGHDVLFETPYFIKGHTAFANTALVMAGGTATNYGYKYQIDKNDGNGWSAESVTLTATTLGTALNGITGIDASLGFKLRLRITTSTTNATAITSVYITTVSTTTAQDYQYPLDTFDLTLTGLIANSDVVILQAGTDTVLGQVDQNAASSWIYTYETPISIDIFVSKAGYVPFYIRNYSLPSSNASLPIAQTNDRNYIT